MADQSLAVSFSGHETFPFRYPWMKKGVDAVAHDSQVFVSDEAMTRLGVGKNMVRSIRHWCLAAGLLAEERSTAGGRGTSLVVSELGRKLLADDGWDPYFEDPATLWLLHWQIASNQRRCTTWHWAFSFVYEPEFTKESLLASLLEWVQTAGAKQIASSSIQRDIDCFLRTYVASRQSQGVVLEDTLDCPLVELNLIQEAGDRQTFQFNRGPQPELPTGVLLFATLDYWQRTAPNAETLSLVDLAYHPGSPGRLFQIDEDSLAGRFEEFESLTKGKVGYGETAGLRQLYRRKTVSPLTILEQTYAKCQSLAGGARGR
jgi:hypothetical protein